ncbi:MAG: cation diffusion facilitator family transporter [Candidatus Polarisedimenticolia bacterium]
MHSTHKVQTSHDPAQARRKLSFAIWLTATVMFVELAGGWWANSLSLLSDAGHMLTDLLALGMAMFAVTMACRPAPPAKTYGYYRIEILAALSNGAILVALCLLIFYEGIRRLFAPQPVDSDVVLLVAGIGLIANLIGMWLLSRSGSLNVKAARLHVTGDALSSAGVLAGGAVISFTSWYWIDSAVSFVIGLVVLWGAFHILKETVDVLLEATPSGLHPADVCRAIEQVPGITGVHDLHIWSITSGMTALSGHVILDADSHPLSDEALNRIKEMLRVRFSIEHTTIQIESQSYTEVGEVH